MKILVVDDEREIRNVLRLLFVIIDADFGEIEEVFAGRVPDEMVRGHFLLPV